MRNEPPGSPDRIPAALLGPWGQLAATQGLPPNPAGEWRVRLWGQRCHPEHGGHSLARSPAAGAGSSPFHLPLFPPGLREGVGLML